MQHWQDSEVRELLLIRGKEEIRRQVTGTVRDTALYKKISKMLSERGIVRNPRQVINKLKALKKKYLAINDQKNRRGMGRVDWPLNELCRNIFGNSTLANPVRLSSSLVTRSSMTPSSSSSSSPISTMKEESEIERDTEGVVKAEPTQVLSTEGLSESKPAEEGGPESETTRTQPLQSSGYFPARRRKRTKMEQASAIITTAMAEQLREMDRAAAARDDARMQMYMEHERSLWEKVSTIQERISREDREHQRSLFGLLLSRLPEPAPQTPQSQPHAMYQYEQNSFHQSRPETTRTQPLQTSGYSVPARRRKRTKMEQASATITTAMAEQLREMDRAAAACDDARMEMYMEHEKSLWERVSTIQERVSGEDREHQRSLFGLLLSRLPDPSPQTPQSQA